MTNGAKKKGLSLVAWIAIGGVGLVVVAAVVMVGLALFLTKKVADVAEGFQGNPMQTVAELAIKAHPDYDLLETDEEAGTIKVRHKETGDSATMRIADVAKGKFEIVTAEGKAYSVSVGEEGVTVKGPDGESTMGLGVSSAEVGTAAAVGASESVESSVGDATAQADSSPD